MKNKRIIRIISVLLTSVMLCMSLTSCSYVFKILQQVYGGGEPFVSDVFEDSKFSRMRLSKDLIYYYKGKSENEPSSVLSISAQEVEEYLGTHDGIPHSSYYVDKIGGARDEILPIIEYGILNGFTKYVYFSYNTSEMNTDEIYWYLSEIFPVDSQYITLSVLSDPDYVLEYEGGYVGGVLPFYYTDMNADDFLAGLGEVLKFAKSVPNDYSDIEKVLYFYRYLTENVAYEDNYYEGEWSLLYDTMIKKSTVCAGYSDALYYYLSALGIDSLRVVGQVVEDGEEISEEASFHQWNIAKVDGEYYVFDPTWDIDVPAGEYVCFAVSDSSLNTGYYRKIEESYAGKLPECPSNYFDDVLTAGNDEDLVDLSLGAVEFINWLRGNPLVEVSVYTNPYLEGEYRSEEDEEGFRKINITRNQFRECYKVFFTNEFVSQASSGVLKIIDNDLYVRKADKDYAYYIPYKVKHDGLKYFVYCYVIDGETSKITKGRLTFTIDDSGYYYRISDYSYKAE